MKQKNGITLIALIITIIVLLILAGVAISMVLGENGLLNNSKEATQKYKDSQEKEELSLILSGYYMAKMQDDTTDLGAYLSENNAMLKEEQTDNHIIEYNGYEFTVKKDSLEIIDISKRTPQQVIVTENGEEKRITVEDIAKNPKKYYGAIVTNYTAGGATYRIFYVDTENGKGKYGDGANTVYLIADYNDNRTSSLRTYEYDASKTKIKEMNPLWSVRRGTATWGENEKAVAYLCDTSKWTTYYDSTKANYVIGCPSIEMYVDSYNQTHNANSLIYTYDAATGTGTNNGNGYFVGANGTYSNSGYNTASNTIDTAQNGIYLSGDLWLASPSAYATNRLLDAVNSPVSVYYGTPRISTCGLRPLVSLQSNIPIQIEL